LKKIEPGQDQDMCLISPSTSKTSSIKIWCVLATGLADGLTQVDFRQPFVDSTC